MITIPLGRGSKYGTITVDTEQFTAPINAYIFEYGLRQVLNDAMATKTDENGQTLPDDQIVAKAQKRLDALYRGELRAVRSAEPVDPIEAEWRRLAKATIHAMYKAANFYDGLPKGTKNRFLAVANERARARGLIEMESEAEVIERFLASSPSAGKLRKEAERLVRDRGAVDLDEMPV